MNKMALIDKCRKVSESKQINFNTVLVTYFFEQFLKRLSHSKYKDAYLFKGGLFIYSLTGINYRYTTDIDFSINKNKLNLETLLEEINEILNININDGIKYEVLDSLEIKENDENGGFKIKVRAIMENMKIPFSIDIALNDPITPKAIGHEYKTLVDDEYIKLTSYNIETVIAEKLETVVSRKTGNSRSKDFYDLYILFKLKSKIINREILQEAIKTTFEHRERIFLEKEVFELLEYIKEDKLFIERWKRFSRNNIFAKGLDFKNVIDFVVKSLKK